MQIENCANCGNEISLKFCPNCGQKKYVRIDGKYIKDEIQYTLLHTNKGFFYSLKKIIQNPGKTTKEFLEGNRVNHYKPILLVFVLAGISTFISYKWLNMDVMMTEYFKNANLNKDSGNQVVESMSSLYNYTTILIMTFIPFLSISSLIAFRKQGHNYFEHIIINCFLYVLLLVFTIFIISPILYFVKDSGTYIGITFLSFLIIPLLMIWQFRGLYPFLSWKSIIVKTILASFLSTFLYMGISFMIGIVIMIITMANK